MTEQSKDEWQKDMEERMHKMEMKSLELGGHIITLMQLIENLQKNVLGEK